MACGLKGTIKTEQFNSLKHRLGTGWAMEFPTLLSFVHILPLGGSTVFCTQIEKGILAGSLIHQQNSTQIVNTQRLLFSTVLILELCGPTPARPCFKQ
jgi:hypothetical protein